MNSPVNILAVFLGIKILISAYLSALEPQVAGIGSAGGIQHSSSRELPRASLPPGTSQCQTNTSESHLTNSVQFVTVTTYLLISFILYSKQKLHMIICLSGYHFISPRIYDFKHLPFSLRCRAPWPYCTLCFGNCAGQFPGGATARSQPV